MPYRYVLIWLCIWLNLIHVSAQQFFFKDSFPQYFVDDAGNDCYLGGFAENGMPLYDCTDNSLDVAKNLGSNLLWPGMGVFQVTGQNFSGLGLFDGGLVRTTHRELNNRIILRDSNLSASSHATLVAGVLAAAGIDSMARGIAHQSQLNVWSLSNDVVKMRSAMSLLKASNHSYSAASGWQQIGGQWYWYGDTTLHLTKDYRFGFYDTRARQWDSLMYANPYYVICKSAGNNRGAFLPPNTNHYYWNGSGWQLTNTTRDTIGPYDCIPTYGNAKNIITVGSNQFLNNQAINLGSQINLLSFSSFGPTDDGRIKPDVVAPSGSVYSTNNTHDSAYAILGGTSASSPSVTASIHLLNQIYFQQYGQYMHNALLKAVVINSCISCQPGNIGPGYNCGWGFPRFDVAARHIYDWQQTQKYAANDYTLFNNDTAEFVFYYTQGDTAKITIAWTDPPAASTAPAFNDTTLKLINDLDMVVLNQSGQPVNHPFVLNPYNPAQPATTGNNYRDNVEQIVQLNQPSGFYKVRITHKNTLTNLQQKFGLAASNMLLQPLKPPVNLAFTQVQANSMRVSFQKGSGVKRLVIAGTQPLTQFPQNGVVYAANDTFGLGSALSQNNFVVYNDTGNQVVIKNLQPNTTYYIRVIEYNGTATFNTVYANNLSLSGSNATLDANLISFKGEYQNGSVTLTWQTASEKNNLGFYIAVSPNGKDFRDLDFVRSSVTQSSVTTNYRYTHVLETNQALPEKMYYQLSTIDFDLNRSKPKTIQVWLHNGDFYHHANVYPNPFQQVLHIKLFEPLNGILSLTFYDLKGRNLIEKHVTLTDNTEVLLDDIQNLPQGLFVLHIHNANFSEHHKVMKH